MADLSRSCKNINSKSKSKKRRLDHFHPKGSMKKYLQQSGSSGSQDLRTSRVDTSPVGTKLRSKGSSPLKHYYSPIKGSEIISIDPDLSGEYKITPEKKKELAKGSSFTLRSPLTRMNGPSRKRALDVKDIQTKETGKPFSEFPDIIDVDDIIVDVTAPKKLKPSTSPNERKSVKNKSLKTSNIKFKKTSSLPLIEDEKKLNFSSIFTRNSFRSETESYPEKDRPKTFINEEKSVDQSFGPCSPIAKDVKQEEYPVWMKNDSMSSSQSSTPLKKAPALRRIVRRSRNNVEENEVLSVASSSKRARKFTVLPDEILSASRIAFHQTYKDLETLLEFKNCNQTCPNFEKAMQYQRQPLSNRYNVNFNFHMGRSNQQLMALGSLRRLSLRFYPIASNVHDVIFKIVENTKDRIVFHRSMELLYNLITFHPSCNSAMRDYYWTVMCQRFEDVDPCSRWDLLRILLEGMKEEEATDASAGPNESEKKRSVLSFFISLLNDDLRCWMRFAHNHSTLLRAKTDVPLIVRLFWSQDGTTVGFINSICREFITIHLKALESQNESLLRMTKSLMKMMTAVTQLSEMQAPLKMRKPGERMFLLAREIAMLSKPTYVRTQTYLNSFGSPEMRLLLSLSVLNRLDPIRLTLEGTQLDFHSILSTHLRLDDSTSRADVIDRFKQQSNEIRVCVLTAIDAYMKLFCLNRAWYVILDRYRHPRYYHNPSVYHDKPTVDFYSRSFSFSHMVEGLKKSKVLLHCTRRNKSFYSTLSVC